MRERAAPHFMYYLLHPGAHLGLACMVADAVPVVLPLPLLDRVRAPPGRGAGLGRLAHHLQSPPPPPPRRRRRRRRPCPDPTDGEGGVGGGQAGPRGDGAEGERRRGWLRGGRERGGEGGEGEERGGGGRHGCGAE